MVHAFFTCRGEKSFALFVIDQLPANRFRNTGLLISHF